MAHVHHALLALALLTLIACTPGATQAPAAPASSSTTATSAEWQKVLDAARKEGKVLVYAERFTGQEGTLINTELQRVAGITVDFISATGAQLVPRYQQEVKAGQPSADIMEGSPTTLTALRTDGSFLPLKDQPLPVLSEPATVWLTPPTFFGDAMDVVVSRLGKMEGHYIVNTRMVQAGDEPKTFHELATDPKFKGKIAWLDPNASAAVTSFLMQHSYATDNITLAEIWSLYQVQQVATLARSGDQEAAVGRGEIPLGLGLGSDRILSLAEAEAPVKIMAFPERPLVSQPAMTGVTKTAQNPNAALVFMNWTMSKEGQDFIKKLKKNDDGIRRDVPSYLPDLLKGQVVGGGKKGPITLLSVEQSRLGNALHAAEIVQKL
ncbi:MAG TPA: extracellular solute-binding protein, partial [Chloroflexota bacterium]|nr:extracellular solute-binding protein [Chloroflexota bacterium]